MKALTFLPIATLCLFAASTRCADEFTDNQRALSFKHYAASRFMPRLGRVLL